MICHHCMYVLIVYIVAYLVCVFFACILLPRRRHPLTWPSALLKTSNSEQSKYNSGWFLCFCTVIKDADYFVRHIGAQHVVQQCPLGNAAVFNLLCLLICFACALRCLRYGIKAANKSCMPMLPVLLDRLPVRFQQVWFMLGLNPKSSPHPPQQYT